MKKLLLKRTLKLFLPSICISLYRNIVYRKNAKILDKKFNSFSNQNIFSTIYQNKLWGTRADNLPMSGHGSHDERHTKPYIETISNLFNESTIPVNVLDLGCGDFSIGKDLVTSASTYVAADVVPDVIKSNSVTYKELPVNFICIDCTKDKLPDSNYLLLRQVLQHLSNKNISNFLANLHKSKIKYLILTELIPKKKFIPNIDSPTGPYSRISRGINSGIVLEKSPFNLEYLGREVLLNIPCDNGVLQTISYKLS
jgi:hypothetical protein